MKTPETKKRIERAAYDVAQGLRYMLMCSGLHSSEQIMIDGAKQFERGLAEIVEVLAPEDEE